MASPVHTMSLYNGNEMPLVGLGCAMKVGATLEAALEAGYRLFDTAYDYRSEADIGQVLKKWLQSGRVKRDELFIVTKLPRSGNRAECVEKYLKKSLEALQLSYVDLYLIHGPIGIQELDSTDPKDMVLDMNTDHITLWKAMEAQVDAGRACSIGLSNFNARQIKRIMKVARIQPANLQVELNVHFQQKELVAFCKALDITVCAYSPLGSPRASSRVEEKMPINDPVVAAISKKHGRTAGQVLLRHIVQRDIVAIPKSSNPARLKENLQVFDFQLDEDDMEKLNALDKGTKNRKFSEDLVKGSEKHPEFPFNEPY